MGFRKRAGGGLAICSLDDPVDEGFRVWKLLVEIESDHKDGLTLNKGHAHLRSIRTHPGSGSAPPVFPGLCWEAGSLPAGELSQERGPVCCPRLKNSLAWMWRESESRPQRQFTGLLIIVETLYCFLLIGFQSPLSSGENILSFFARVTLFQSPYPRTKGTGWDDCEKLGR